MTSVLEDCKILIIESNFLLSTLAEQLLTQAGIKKVMSASVEGALEILDLDRVDLAIMPPPDLLDDGEKLWNKLKIKNANLPVIILIDENSDWLHTSAYRQVVTATVMRPVKGKSLRDSVIKCLLPPGSAKSRVHERLAIRQEIVWVFSDFEHHLSGVLTNISARGAFIETTAVLPAIGNIVEVESSNQKDISSPIRTFSGLGVVRWLKDDIYPKPSRGFGIEFAALPVSSKNAISQLVEGGGESPVVKL